MGHTLIALLVANVVLVTGTAGSVLYTAGLPYPYISSYAFTYAYAHPPLLLPHPLSLECEGEPLSVSGALPSPPPVTEVSLEGITADEDESQGILPNQSTSELSSGALGGTAPPLTPESAPPAGDSSPLPAPISPAPVPTALGEAAPSPTAALDEAAPSAPAALDQAALLPPAAPAPAPAPAAANELRYHLSLPITYTIPTPLTWPTASQYHQQDELGQYNYGYANEHSSKQEFKLLDGITRGAYNYIDAEGKIQTVSYVSDGEGFRVAASNLPQPAVPVDIPDSPEVAAAKAAHLQAQSEAVANVNSANAADEAAAAVAAAAANASGNNAVSGCNDPSGGSSTSTEI